MNPVASYVFKPSQNDAFAAEKIFQKRNKLKISNVALLFNNTGFGEAEKGQIKKIAPKCGIEIVKN